MKLIKIIQERGLRFKGAFDSNGTSGIVAKILALTTLKVECSAVANDFDEAFASGKTFPWKGIPCATPPMEDTWVEFALHGKRLGVIVHRESVLNGFQLAGVIVGDINGHFGAVLGRFECLLSEHGKVDGSVRGSENTEGIIFVALHAISRMHCKNIKLSPVGQPKQSGWKPDELPGKFLREIVITSVPQTRSTGRSIFRSERMRREHWVRGHYADYRTHGLFGRIKGLFWIPEHKAGSAALGTTEHQYRIAS